MSKKQYSRSEDYRRKFFQKNRGIFRGGNYHCSYCGKILRPNKMQVDHLIPVYRVKRFGFGRLMMHISGIEDINDVKNLIPSCERCNAAKGSKMGLWLVRGAIGRHFWVWLFWWSFLLAAVVLVAVYHWSDILSFYKSAVQYLESIRESLR